jgi:hypothetical protein
MKEKRRKTREVRPRLSGELHKLLKEAAEKAKRSITRQVEMYIEQGLIKDGYQIEDERRRKERIGEMFVRLGRMNEEQVQKVLQIQKQDNGRFGEIAIKEGFINRETLDEYLGDA